jgi:hypothetical protein
VRLQNFLNETVKEKKKEGVPHKERQEKSRPLPARAKKTTTKKEKTVKSNTGKKQQC